MTQQDTQPPAETLAEAREIAALFYDKRDPLDASCRDIAHNIRRGRYDHQDAVELVRFTMAHLAALTRRAGGDAIPAGEGLRTCPHCGGPAKFITPMGEWVGKGKGVNGGSYAADRARYVCAGLYEDSPRECAAWKTYDTEAEARAAWNNRPATLNVPAGGDAIPAGWQLVPVEPVDVMREAASNVPIRSMIGTPNMVRVDYDEADAIWSAMRTTTPKPPAGGDAEVESIWDSYRLPCDVHLAPVTIIRAGCQLSTLKVAMEASWRPRHFEGHPNAALALPAPVVEGDVEKEARFLCDRLAEFEREITDDDQFTQFNGHVSPSAARLRAALSEGRSHG